jgi:hypothetical protein
MKATLSSSISNTVIRVNKVNNSLNSTSPVVLKNQITQLRSIEDIADVVETNVTDGATLVYNAALDKYEVKLLNLADQAIDLDGGTF